VAVTAFGNKGGDSLACSVLFGFLACFWFWLGGRMRRCRWDGCDLGAMHEEQAAIQCRVQEFLREPIRQSGLSGILKHDTARLRFCYAERVGEPLRVPRCRRLFFGPVTLRFLLLSAVWPVEVGGVKIVGYGEGRELPPQTERLNRRE